LSTIVSRRRGKNGNAKASTNVQTNPTSPPSLTIESNETVIPKIYKSIGNVRLKPCFRQGYNVKAFLKEKRGKFAEVREEGLTVDVTQPKVSRAMRRARGASLLT
jgi:hypothetical protein